MINENIDNEIKFLAKSGIRLKILKELKRKPHTIRELVKSTKITYSSVSSNVHKLEKSSYIIKANKKYHITPLSEIYFNSLMEFKESLDFIYEFNDFWSKHDISQINNGSLKRITDLTESELIETTPLEIYKTHDVIRTDLEKAHSLKAIFPFVHPDYPKIIEDILQNKGNVELIMHPSLFKGIIHKIDTSLRKQAHENGNLKIYLIKNDLKLHLSITDYRMHLGLFKTDNSFDQNRILTSDSKKSLGWADDLFEDIKNKVIE